MPRYVVTLDYDGDRCTLHDVDAGNAIEAVVVARRDLGVPEGASLVSAVEVGP